MYKISDEKVDKLEPVTFSDLNMIEDQVEELLRNNIEMICDEEESMLVIGQQVRNEKNARSDLTAIDDRGNLVLIEIKRDKKDMKARKEAFEFQAIRYAASYASIQHIDDLINKVYAPYIERYHNEFKNENLTYTEIANRKLFEFLEDNEALNNFNQAQKIVLVASDFDDQTLSAVAWLNQNGVDISCYKLIPYQMNDGNEFLIDVEKILPVEDNGDFYVNLLEKSSPIPKIGKKITRRNLPKIKDMLRWGAVKEGDILTAKNHPEYEARLLSNGYIQADGVEMSIAKWLKEIYGWSTIQTYAFTIHRESGRTLSEIRKEYMDNEYR